MIEIRIDEKYLDIFKNKKKVVYFEHFESERRKSNVIKMSIEDPQGEKFIEENDSTIQYADVYWFGSKKLRYRVIFRKDYMPHLILIVPNELKINSSDNTTSLQN